ncbi:MAG: creatininase family protein [Sphaerobacter sp.]|nr:creatininase family protein [Sphaerobacter sp.]
MAEIRRLADLHWPDVRAALERGTRTVVAAAGSMEQHGPHLPFQTDTLLGTVLAEAVAARLDNVLVGPTIPFGVSDHHMAFPGTITLDVPTFQAVVRQYVASLAQHGFTAVLVIPSHGGNFGPLRALEEETGGRIGGARFLPYTDLMAFLRVMEEAAAVDGITPQVAGAHAGEAETSMVLASRPDLVDMSQAAEGFVGTFDDAAARLIFERGMTALTANGILGDARPAAAARGQRYIASLADMLADYFRERLPE